MVAKSYKRGPKPSHFPHTSSQSDKKHTQASKSRVLQAHKNHPRPEARERTVRKTFSPLGKANWWTEGQQLGGEAQELHQVLHQAHFGSTKVVAHSRK